MPRLVLVMLLLATTLGCKKKPPSTFDASTSGGFVAIDLGDEDEALDQLYGTELMTATAECGDLVKLEPSAMMGKLKDGEIRCLDKALRTAERQTVKDKLSRVLMADAWSKANTERWEAIVRRHLETIDRSDPDLCYKFALHLVKKGPSHADETMHWADVALENRSLWTGDLHVKRVNALYRIKAVAAQEKWSHLEAKYAQEASEDGIEELKNARNQAKTLAREWLEYARASGKDPTVAMQLCTTAAGTSEFCEDTN